MSLIAHDMATVEICRDRFAYTSHPWITVLHNGEWLVAFKQARRIEGRLHPTEFPLYHTMLTRSADQGRTWSTPRVAPDYDWYGTEVPGVTQLSNGTVALSHFRFAWYPLPVARKLHDAGEEMYLNLPGRSWTREFDDADWDRVHLPWARGPHGLYVHLSRDGGHTFDDTTRIDCSPYHDGYNRTGVVELSDGRLVHPVLEQHIPRPDRHLLFLTSTTGGLTWEAPTLMAKCSEDFITVGEQSVVEVAPGELYCVMRDTMVTGHLLGCRSTDGGSTWSAPERTPMFGHPGHVIKLSDGRLLCSYSRREAPHGIRACLSEDGGGTWLIDDEIVLRDDFPDADHGYPTTVEYEPGKLFTVYYGKDRDGVTFVQGSYFSLG